MLVIKIELSFLSNTGSHLTTMQFIIIVKKTSSSNHIGESYVGAACAPNSLIIIDFKKIERKKKVI